MRDGTAEIIEAYERCPRLAFWQKDWRPRKLTHTQALQNGIEVGLTENTREDYGQCAGEHLFGLGADPGLLTDSLNQYDEIVHLSALSDIIVSALRKPKSPPWQHLNRIGAWEPTCYISPDSVHLRRVVLVSSWSDDRHYSVCRSWQTLGPVCLYEKEMQIAVVVLGNHRDDKYHSHWTKGLLHPVNRKLKFRKKNDPGIPFKGSWKPIFREENDQISTQEWLDGMLADDVLRDVCFPITVAVPKKEYRQQIIDLAHLRVEQIEKQTELPPMQLSTCSWPIRCQFFSSCHRGELPSGKYGLVKIN
jgi:hypothetical protein